jgi:hypothetical protein
MKSENYFVHNQHDWNRRTASDVIYRRSLNFRSYSALEMTGACPTGIWGTDTFLKRTTVACFVLLSQHSSGSCEDNEDKSEIRTRHVMNQPFGMQSVWCSNTFYSGLQCYCSLSPPDDTCAFSNFLKTGNGRQNEAFTVSKPYRILQYRILHAAYCTLHAARCILHTAYCILFPVPGFMDSILTFTPERQQDRSKKAKLPL